MAHTTFFGFKVRIIVPCMIFFLLLSIQLYENNGLGIMINALCLGSRLEEWYWITLKDEAR
jgi:hypothetical protein